MKSLIFRRGLSRVVMIVGTVLAFALSAVVILSTTDVNALGDQEIDEYVAAGKLKWYQPSDVRMPDVGKLKEVKKHAKKIEGLAKLIAGMAKKMGKDYGRLALAIYHARQIEALARTYGDITSVEFKHPRTKKKIRGFQSGVINECCQGMQYHAIQLRQELAKVGKLNVTSDKAYKAAMTAIDNMCRIAGLRERGSEYPDRTY